MGASINRGTTNAAPDNQDPQKDVYRLCLQQACFYSASYPLPLACSVILGHVACHSHAKGIVDQDGKLVHLCGRCIACYSIGSQGIDSRLHGQLADAHHGHLKSHGQTGFQMDQGVMLQIRKILFANMQNRKFFRSPHCTEYGRKKLGKNRRPRGSRYAHVKSQNKYQIQHDIQQEEKIRKYRGVLLSPSALRILEIIL